jgi:hypothetical protein
VRRLLAAVLLAALAVIALAGCTTGLTHEAAQERAIAAFSAPDAHEGPVQDVMVLESIERARDGHRGWEFTLSGTVVLPGLPDGMVVSSVLFVDADSGAVSIVAQG